MLGKRGLSQQFICTDCPPHPVMAEKNVSFLQCGDSVLYKVISCPQEGKRNRIPLHLLFHVLYLSIALSYIGVSCCAPSVLTV